MPERSVGSYFYLLAAIFSAAFLTGVFVPLPGKERLIRDLETALEPFRTLTASRLFLFILVNNTVKAFLVMILGLLFGIAPLFAVTSNGYVLGVAYLYASAEMGYGGALLSLVPHGIFEIPAIILSSAYGLWLGMAVVDRLRQGKRTDLGARIRHAVTMYFKIILPLFVIAAFVETYLIHLSRGNSAES
jgi:stage II sporulation protein M